MVLGLTPQPTHLLKPREVRCRYLSAKLLQCAFFAGMVDTKQPEALAVIGIFLGVSTLFVVLRICARVIAWQNEGRFDKLMMWSKLPIFTRKFALYCFRYDRRMCWACFLQRAPNISHACHFSYHFPPDAIKEIEKACVWFCRNGEFTATVTF